MFKNSGSGDPGKAWSIWSAKFAEFFRENKFVKYVQVEEAELRSYLRWCGQGDQAEEEPRQIEDRTLTDEGAEYKNIWVYYSQGRGGGGGGQ